MIELVLKGSPFKRGHQHGERFAKRIQRDASALWADSAVEQTLAAINETACHIDKLFPEINEEIRGIASGAGIEFQQAFLFNNRSILEAITADGCSHVAVIRDGTALVGMNKDLSNPDPTAYFMRRVQPDRGYARVGYQHIGRVWGYGVNEAGLCAAGTSAQPACERCVIPSLGLYFVGPIVLSRCGTTAEAVELMLGLGDISESGNVLVADESDAAVVEFSPDRQVVRMPENGSIASTNFYASGEIEHASDKAYLEETKARYENILRLTEGTATVEQMKQLLSHHAQQGAVCRHSDAADRTVFSWIADAMRRRFLIAEGPPCSAPYVEYQMG